MSVTLDKAKSQRKKTREIPAFSIYLEPELKAKAEDIARRERRSVNAQICLMIEQWIDRHHKDAK